MEGNGGGPAGSLTGPGGYLEGLETLQEIRAAGANPAAELTLEEKVVTAGQIRALALTKPTTKEETWWWFKNVLGLHFPRWLVNDSSGPISPAEVLYTLCDRQVRMAVLLGARDTGKTLLCSGKLLYDCLFHPNCEVLDVGASERQAERCYSYFKNHLDRTVNDPPFNLGLEVNSRTGITLGDVRIFGVEKGPIILERRVQLTEFTNGSKAWILPGTYGAVSGPHPHTALADEVDLWDWNVLQKWWGMASSVRGNITAQRILTSTRETFSGTMQRLIEEAPERGLVLWSWNIWDAMVGCRKTHALEAPETGCLALEAKQKGDPHWTRTCVLWDGGCRGKAINADGAKPYLDALDIYTGTDPETWETQYLCDKPARKGLVYAAFDERIHVSEAAEYHPDKGPIYFGGDPGWVDPYAVVFAQEGRYALDIFDMLYCREVDTKEVKRIVVTGLWPPDPKEPFAQPWRREWFESVVGQFGTYAGNVDVGYLDPRFPEDIREWNSLTAIVLPGGEQTEILPSFRVMAAPSTAIVDGIAKIRRRLKVTPQGPGLRIHPRCKALIWEMGSGYSYHVDPRTNEPTGDKPSDKNNHACDALRYLIEGREVPAPGIR